MVLGIKSIDPDPLAVASIEPDTLAVASIEEPKQSNFSNPKFGPMREVIAETAPRPEEGLNPQLANPGALAEEMGAAGHEKVGAAVATIADLLPTSAGGMVTTAAAQLGLTKALGLAGEYIGPAFKKSFPKKYEFLTKERSFGQGKIASPEPTINPIQPALPEEPKLAVADISESPGPALSAGPAPEIPVSPRLQSYDKYYTPSTIPGEAPESAFVRENLDQFMKSYDQAAMAELKSTKPNYVSADLAKTVDVEGRPSFEPEFSATRHESGSAIAKMKYEELLNDPATADQPVLISAGISGAGKTSGIKKIGINTDKFAAVYDTNLASLGSAKRAIDLALESSPNREVSIYYVNRDPIQAFENGVFRRFENHPEHRIVPIDAFLSTLDSKETAIQVAEHYANNPRVIIHVLDNDVPKGTPPELMSLDELRNVVYNKSDLKGVLDGFIKEQYQTGRLSESEAQTFLGTEKQGAFRPSGPADVEGAARGIPQGLPSPEVVPSLTEPQLKIKASEGIASEMKKFFSVNPTGIGEANEGARINIKMAAAIRSGQVRIEDIPILKEFGMTNADAGMIADKITEQATFAGQALNFLSQVKKAFPEGALKDVPIGPKTAWQIVAGRFKWLGDKANTATRGLIGIWKSSLISQLSTAAANQIVTIGRVNLKILDDAAIGAVESIAGLNPPRQAFGPALEDMAAVLRRFTPAGREKLANILADEPIAAQRLYGTPMSDITFGGKYSKLLSIFNTTQEFFNRNLVFDASLTGSLRRAGFQSLKEVPSRDMQIQFMRGALNDALDITMAKNPESKIGQAWVKFFNDVPVASVLSYPFMRYLTNAMRFTYEWSPFGAARFLSPKYADILASGDKREAIQVLTRAAIGSAMLATAIHIRNSSAAGGKYYEVKPQPEENPSRVFDVRRYAPFSTYLFLAQAMKDPSGLDTKDWVEGLLGINRMAGTTLFMTSMVTGMGPDKAKEVIKQLAGQFLGGFSTPFRTFKDFVAHFSKEEAIPRETASSPLTAPFLANVPFASRNLPPYYSPTRPEPKAQEAPIIKQATGMRLYTKNAIEEEIDKVGLKSTDFMPKTGIPEADNEVRKIMGQVIDKQISPLINSDFYKNITTPVKREILKAEIGKLRADIAAVIFGNSQDFIVKRAEHRLPPDILDLIKKKRFDILGQFPESMQKNIDKTLLQPAGAE